jgi:hypothetical protein
MRVAEFYIAINHEGHTYYDLEVECEYSLKTETEDYEFWGKPVRTTNTWCTLENVTLVNYKAEDYEPPIDKHEFEILLMTKYFDVVEKILNDEVDPSDLDYDETEW